MKYILDNVSTPWLASYGEVPAHLDYLEKTMSEAVMDTARREGDFPALAFMGRKISFGSLAENIDRAARAFYALGVRAGQRVLVCLPNVPQAIYCLYGLNRIGAVAAMVHPLSAVSELAFYMDEASCDIAVTLDQFYSKFKEVEKQRPVSKLIIARVSEELPFPLSLGQKLLTERKFPKIRTEGNVVLWKDLLKGAESVGEGYVAQKDYTSEAVVLFSGGTTGTTKGIMLSDLNFNALAQQTEAMCNKVVRHAKMLAAMPVFHGFGLGVCIHTMMVAGGTSILVPRFNVKSYANLIKKNRPNFIAGVPTLFEAITRNQFLDGADLSCLQGVFSGGDSLTIELKKKFDKFLAEHNAGVRVREGYGTTDGHPWLHTGVHADGHTWLHTGDLGVMDAEGFVYFRQRIKRMIVTSGYNVYPSQIENVLEGHPAVQRSCVIGVRDDYKMQRVKAFLVLADGYEDTPGLRDEIMAHCRKHIAKYALPSEIEVRDSLPTTLVGKVAYTKLEQEEAA